MSVRASELLRGLGCEVAAKHLGQPGVGELIDALPEIIAVVEAAEQAEKELEIESKEWVVASALDALAAKLSD